GAVQMPGAMAANLLGVQNDVGVITNVLGNGGIPACVPVAGSCSTTGGQSAAAVQISMVWTEFTSNGTTFELDPSLKSYTQYTPIELATATQYTQSSFLAGVLGGSSSVPGVPGGIPSIKNLNRASVTSQLNSYSQNLTNYIRANFPGSSSKQLFGSRDINNANFMITLSTDR